MLQVTDNAMAICNATVRQLSTGAGIKCLRLVAQEGNIALSFECPRDGDEVLQRNGYAVLALPANTPDGVSEMTLDVEDDGRFTLS